MNRIRVRDVIGTTKQTLWDTDGLKCHTVSKAVGDSFAEIAFFMQNSTLKEPLLRITVDCIHLYEDEKQSYIDSLRRILVFLDSNWMGLNRTEIAFCIELEKSPDRLKAFHGDVSNTAYVLREWGLITITRVSDFEWIAQLTSLGRGATADILSSNAWL